MPTPPRSLDELIRALPPEAQEQLRAHAEQLYQQAVASQGRPFQFEWEGALEFLKEQYTSVELQHDLLKERECEVSD